MKAGSIDRKQVHAFHVRQIAALGDSELRTELENVWGKLSDSSAEKRRLIREHQQKLRPVVLKRANLGNGRRLFDKTCASCHMLFGTGGKVGPDLTGANRANLDYVLENIVDPSAVLGKDYRMTLLQLDSGRLVSGLIQDESESAVTMVTLNETVVVPKSEINQRKLSDLSMMPEKLLEPLTADEVRDLVGYLGSPRQVALRGPSAAIDQATGRVPDALEGEAMTVLKPTVGQTRSQDMKSFSKDRWSGNEQLFWTGAKPKDRLSLEFAVDQSGLYQLELVLTRARDYGIIQLYLDDKKIGSALDLFHSPDVLTTGVLSYNSNRLSAGKHQLTIEVLGAHPEAIKAYMLFFGAAGVFF